MGQEFRKGMADVAHSCSMMSEALTVWGQLSGRATGIIWRLLHSHVWCWDGAVSRSASMWLLLMAWVSSCCGILREARFQKQVSQETRWKLRPLL